MLFFVFLKFINGYVSVILGVFLQNVFKDYRLWVAVSLLIITGILMYMVYARILLLHYEFAGELVHHWFSWAGVLFVAFFIPAYHLLKRRYPKHYRTLLTIHMFGNLIALMFVSIHFTQQISRPAVAYPDLGTGIVLYPTMLLLVFAGFVLAFKFSKKYRSWWFFHTSLAVTFYMVIVVHVLHGLEII